MNGLTKCKAFAAVLAMLALGTVAAITVMAQVLTNDDFANAIQITLPFIDIPPNPGLESLEPNEPLPDCTLGNTPGNTLWYAFTPSESRLYRVDLVSSNALFAGIYTGFSNGERIFEQC